MPERERQWSFSLRVNVDRRERVDDCHAVAFLSATRSHARTRYLRENANTIGQNERVDVAAKGTSTEVLRRGEDEKGENIENETDEPEDQRNGEH